MYTQLRPSGRSLWIMKPSCALELASPNKNYFHGQQKSFRSLHAKTPLETLWAHGLQSTCMYTQPLWQDQQLKQAVSSPGTFLHTHMPSYSTHRNVLFSFYQIPCSIHAHLCTLRYLTRSHLLHATETRQCAHPNFSILTVHALGAYCIHISSTSNGLHRFQLQCPTRSFYFPTINCTTHSFVPFSLFRAPGKPPVSHIICPGQHAPSCGMDPMWLSLHRSVALYSQTAPDTDFSFSIP